MFLILHLFQESLYGYYNKYVDMYVFVSHSLDEEIPLLNIELIHVNSICLYKDFIDEMCNAHMICTFSSHVHAACNVSRNSCNLIAWFLMKIQTPVGVHNVPKFLKLNLINNRAF